MLSQCSCQNLLPLILNEKIELYIIPKKEINIKYLSSIPALKYPASIIAIVPQKNKVLFQKFSISNFLSSKILSYRFIFKSFARLNSSIIFFLTLF